MTKPFFRNIPAPEGSKPTANRFIPAEELGSFAAWTPGSLAGAAAASAAARAAAAAPAAAAPAAPVAPAAPTAADWQARVTAARQSGYQDGYRDGLVALESFKASFAQQATSQIGALLLGFDAQFEQLDASLAQVLADTAVLLARQVLRTELQTRPEVVAAVAAEAVAAVMLSARQITVLVHPQDLPLVAEGAAEVLATRGARLVASSQVERGGVLVHSDVGQVDAAIGRRWAVAAAALGSAAALDPARAPLNTHAASADHAAT